MTILAHLKTLQIQYQHDNSSTFGKDRDFKMKKKHYNLSYQFIV